LTFLELDIFGTISYVKSSSKPDNLEQRLSELRESSNLLNLLDSMNLSLEFKNHINLLKFLSKWELNFFKQEIVIEKKESIYKPYKKTRFVDFLEYLFKAYSYLLSKAQEAYSKNDFDEKDFLPDLDEKVLSIFSIFSCFKNKGRVSKTGNKFDNMHKISKLLDELRKYNYSIDLENYVLFVDFVHNWVVNHFEIERIKKIKEDDIGRKKVEALLNEILIGRKINHIWYNQVDFNLFFDYKDNEVRVFNDEKIPDKFNLSFPFAFCDEKIEKKYEESKGKVKDFFSVNNLINIVESKAVVSYIKLNKCILSIYFDNDMVFTNENLELWKLYEINDFNVFNYYKPNWSIYCGRKLFRSKSPIKEFNGRARI